jgi:hypothetical protein
MWALRTSETRSDTREIKLHKSAGVEGVWLRAIIKSEETLGFEVSLSKSNVL